MSLTTALHNLPPDQQKKVARIIGEELVKLHLTITQQKKTKETIQKARQAQASQDESSLQSLRNEIDNMY